ncbi:alpha-amylase family glycosyl hydrolase [Flavobacteriaceae bacterium M23B6Z8]
MRKLFLLILSCMLLSQCKKTSEKVQEPKNEEVKASPFAWEAANVYFLLTDRFNIGNPNKKIPIDRDKTTGLLRNFMGGDIAGITQKIEEGYFDKLGVNAIWLTPVIEQIHGSVDEGTGNTYAFHGYWAKDWTTLDPNFGTLEDLKAMVKSAHDRGIRILLDVVVNHTGPVTDLDPVYPEDWVRTGPQCEYTNYENTTSCTLVANLPDVRTDSEKEVELPPMLIEKWQKEGRLEQEIAELDAFFERTGYPRAPRFYIIKWLTDYITDLGVDGFRVDTVKHTQAHVWKELEEQASYYFKKWKQDNPEKVLDDNPFYMVGEVYGYGVSGGRMYDFGNKKVDFFDNGFKSLINFEFKSDAHKDYETVFSKYDSILSTTLKDKSVLNYLSSHDDGQPFDQNRENSFKAGNMLLLTPGASQIYYGDESLRPLLIPGTDGDATLRSFMNWEDLERDSLSKATFDHYSKLGRFRKDHPAVGGGKHEMISKDPYLFKRSYTTDGFMDKVLIGLDLSEGEKIIEVASVFEDGTMVRDAYSNTMVKVASGKAVIDSPFTVVLLEKTK